MSPRLRVWLKKSLGLVELVNLGRGTLNSGEPSYVADSPEHKTQAGNGWEGEGEQHSVFLI